MRKLGKSRRGHIAPPGLEPVVHAEAAAAPPFLVGAARIGAEQDALGLERGTQFPQYARQLLRGHMKQRGVREDTVEITVGQVELQEILLPHFATRRGARHRHERRRALQPDRAVTELRERRQVAPGAAAEVENRERRRSGDVLQQRRDVLADIVIARALPEVLRMRTIVLERAIGELLQFLRGEGLDWIGHSTILPRSRV